MTKMIKMSLIAAVAVTGMTSVATAQPLEEAIKGVDVSGQLRYRYDDTKKDNTASTQTNEYTMKIATKSKVNDIVTANVQVEARGVTRSGTAAGDILNTSGTSAGNAHATTDVTGDRDVNLVVTKANFSANLGFATVIAGKQSVPSPLVDNHSDDTTRGTGAVALVPAGSVTVAAGYFNNFQSAQDINTATLVDKSAYSGNNISALAVLGTVADVAFDAWYVDVANTASAISIGANAKVAGVTIDARHSSVSPDAAGSKDGDLTKIIASTKLGEVSVLAGFAVTGDSLTNVTLDGDNDAKSDLRLWQASVGGLNDATALLIGAGMDVMPNVNVDAKYVTVDHTVTAKEVTTSELLVGITYKMSKNFGVHARYSMLDNNNVDTDKGRLELKYTF